jgi:predicted nucleotide-binding protein (sugar kinase/HSP70/actin superfamily)
VHNCSKFLGLPDLTRAVVPESPPILEVEIDVDQGKRALYQAIYSLGRRFSCNPLKVKRAAQSAWQAHQDYVARMRSQGLTPLQVLEGQSIRDETRGYHLSLAVIGHPYLVYDSFVNHRLLERLDRGGVKVYTPEMVPQAGLDEAMAQIVGQAYWTYEAEVVGAGGYYLENQVAGVIGVAAFGCGPDSLMFEMVERRAKKLRGCSFMSLMLDEHTAEAGLVTRLEAFLDMIQRRRQVTACG